jgi:oligopeptide/dipeptide ABC transporter ATP-binding protein
MYAGRLVEDGDVYSVFESPKHPYTHQLLRSVPRFPAAAQRVEAIGGGVPDLSAPAPGCAFAPRCERYLGAVCDSLVPALAPAGSQTHRAACHLYA